MIARVDIANQASLAKLRAVDPVAVAEWDREFDAVWMKYADIASRLAEHEVYDPAGLELLDELDREVGQLLFEDLRYGLLLEVGKRLGYANIGVDGNRYWSVGHGQNYIYHWWTECPVGQRINPRNRRGDPVPPEEARECKFCRSLTDNRNWQ